MKTQVFIKADKKVSDLEYETQAQIQSLTSHGFAAKAATLQSESRIMALSLAYYLMSKEEERTWRAFLPTAYQRGQGGWITGTAYTGIYGYNADTPPSEVLDLMDKVKPDFTRLEIWTPELSPSGPLLQSPNPDPILVGIHGDRVFLLARWAESLASGPEIVKIAARKRIFGTAIMGSNDHATLIFWATVSSVIVMCICHEKDSGFSLKDFILSISFPTAIYTIAGIVGLIRYIYFRLTLVAPQVDAA